MKNLNLDIDFEPYGQSIPFETFTFNGGEPHIKIKASIAAGEAIRICTRIRSFNDMGFLMIAVDALRRMGVNEIHLLLPYFPGARQDRVMVPGEPLTVKVYADLVNGMNFQKVTILDPHSEVTSAILERTTILSNHEFVKQAISDRKNYLLVAPDGGALKKIYGLSKALGVVPVIECGKQRDVTTGQLSGFTVYKEDLANQTCIIVDDICDGGGTFLGLAEALKKKNAGELILMVTHGIFSKGLDHLSQHFSAIYTTDSFSTIDDPRLSQIHLKNLLQ